MIITLSSSFKRFIVIGFILCSGCLNLTTSQQCLNGQWQGTMLDDHHRNNLPLFDLSNLPIGFFQLNVDAVQTNYQPDSMFSIALEGPGSLPFWQSLSSNGVIDGYGRFHLDQSVTQLQLQFSCNSECTIDYTVCIQSSSDNHSQRLLSDHQEAVDDSTIRLLSEGGDLPPPPLLSPHGVINQDPYNDEMMNFPNFRASEVQSDDSSSSHNSPNTYGSDLLEDDQGSGNPWSRSADNHDDTPEESDSGVSLVTVILGIAGIAVVGLLLIICAMQLIWKSEKESSSTNTGRCTQRPFDRVVPFNENMACAEPSQQISHASSPDNTNSHSSLPLSNDPIDASSDNPYLTSVPPITPGTTLSAKC